MDDLATIDVAGPFSLVYAVYSLHYAADPGRVVHTAAELLRGPDARLVVVTPEVGNNAAWFADLGQLYALPADTLAVPAVGQRVFAPALRAACRSVTHAVLESDIVFESLAALMRYYDACPHYCRRDRREDARRHFARYFERGGAYRITKRSLGLVGRP
jgi:SAM-dependent methyltransferase